MRLLVFSKPLNFFPTSILITSRQKTFREAKKRMDALYKELNYPSKTILKKEAKKRGFSEDEIDAFLKSSAITPFIVEKPKKVDYTKLPHRYGLYQRVFMTDLIDLSRFSRIAANKNYKYLLTLLNYDSRYVWAFPLKTKKPTEIEPYLRSVLDTISPKWTTRMITDVGSEFKGVVEKLFDDLNINVLKNFPASPTTKGVKRTAPLERFHRTFWNALSRVFQAENTNNWLSVFPKIIETYNKKVHGTLGLPPKVVWRVLTRQKPENHIIFTDPVAQAKKIQERRIKVGDWVRVLIPRDTFDKKSFGAKTRGPYEVTSYEENGLLGLSVNGKKEIHPEQELILSSSVIRPQESHLMQRETELKKSDFSRKQVRKARKEVAIGHEAVINDNQDVQLKPRLLPTTSKQGRRAVAKK